MAANVTKTASGDAIENRPPRLTRRLFLAGVAVAILPACRARMARPPLTVMPAAGWTSAPPAPASPSGAVLNGIDLLAAQGFAPLKHLRVGLITNQTGVDRQRRATIDLLRNAPEVQLTKLFSPEHGIRGELDEKVGDTTDARSGLPVFSLYGARRSPTPEQLRDLDALVFDIQDIGCRFYTYISTLGLCLEAAGRAGKKFFVLDRVNPIGGLAVEGPVHHGASSFTAFHSLPLRHGLTVGELARMFNAERGFKAALEIIPVTGWKRSQWFDQTGLPWINPSPNMRSLTAATFYPGVGLLEFSLSVGRGTATPFEILGAPYADEVKLAMTLNQARLPGVRFTPARFTPESSIFKGRSCGGVRLELTSRESLRSADLGLLLAHTFQRLYPGDFTLEKVQTLLQDRTTLDAVKAGRPWEEIKKTWQDGLRQFESRRARFLIYS